jgi:hypothetical protein
MTTFSIGTPIGYPIGSYRAYPNRPRIAPIESARVVSYRPLLVAVACGVSNNDQIQSNGDLGALAAPIGFGAKR